MKTNHVRLRGLTGWIVRRLVGREADWSSMAVRSRLGEWEGIVSTILSVLLTLTKAVLAWISSSISLFADALNNMADIGSSLMVTFGFRLARKPRDREHPFGHGRIESVLTLVLAIILIGVAIEVARAGIRRLLAPAPCVVPNWLLASVGFTVLVKCWLAVFARKLARLTGSATLEADGWNHTYDILSTSLVVVALVGSRLGWPGLDGWAGLGVSAFIAYTGYKYTRQGIGTLLGERPSHDELHAIHACARNVPGVFGVHDIIVHRYGENRHIALHAEVDANQSALAVHELAERVEAAVAALADAKVIVHADPVDHSHPRYPDVAAALHTIIRKEPGALGFHDLRVADAEGHTIDIHVDIVVCAETAVQDFGAYGDRLAAAIRQEVFAVRRLDMGVETEYASDREHRRQYPAPSSS